MRFENDDLDYGICKDLQTGFIERWFGKMFYTFVRENNLAYVKNAYGHTILKVSKDTYGKY